MGSEERAKAIVDDWCSEWCEKPELKAKLASANETICTMKDALQETMQRTEILIIRGDIATEDVRTTRQWQDHVKRALSSAPVCPHKKEQRERKP